MNDDILRDADPYRAEVMSHLDGADQDLLREIVSAPHRRAVPLRRFAAPIAAAAAVAAVLGAVALHQRQTLSHPDAAPAHSLPATSAGIDLKAAESNPRLLVDEPGWKAVTVYGFAAKAGTIGFRNGDLELEFDWYPADQYVSYYQDRLGVSAPEPATVDGMPGSRFTYSANDFAIMLKPRNGLFVEMRTENGPWTRAGFDQVLPHIKQVDARTFLAAMPPEIVTPDRAAAAAGRVLADIPLPPGFDRSSVADLGINDAYQFGAHVTTEVGCGWIADWKHARQTGDTAEAQRAVHAMTSSHHWRVLNEMNPQGDWPESFWEIADNMAKGRLLPGTEDTLGC